MHILFTPTQTVSVSHGRWTLEKLSELQRVKKTRCPCLHGLTTALHWHPFVCLLKHLCVCAKHREREIAFLYAYKTWTLTHNHTCKVSFRISSALFWYPWVSACIWYLCVHILRYSNIYINVEILTNFLWKVCLVGWAFPLSGGVRWSGDGHAWCGSTMQVNLYTCVPPLHTDYGAQADLQFQWDI